MFQIDIKLLAIVAERPHQDKNRVLLPDEDVARIRASLDLTQAAFARMLGIPVKTLQKWECAETKPSGSASMLLKIAVKRPDVLHELQEV